MERMESGERKERKNGRKAGKGSGERGKRKKGRKAGTPARAVCRWLLANKGMNGRIGRMLGKEGEEEVQNEKPISRRI
jgi:hypothetical protein